MSKGGCLTMPVWVYLAAGALLTWLLGRWLERCADRLAEAAREEEQC